MSCLAEVHIRTVRQKSFPLKSQRWRPFHWQRWDQLTPSERLAYEQRVEDKDNAHVMAHIRGNRQSRRVANRTFSP